MKENLKLKGQLLITVVDKDGNFKDERKIENLVVTAGLDWITATFGAGSGTAMSHVGVGTNNTAADAADTALLSEIDRAAITDTSVNQVASDVVYTSVFSSGVGTGALVEAGIFNAPTSGTMLARTTFAVINKAANDSMQITWTITLTAS